MVKLKKLVIKVELSTVDQLFKELIQTSTDLIVLSTPMLNNHIKKYLIAISYQFNISNYMMMVTMMMMMNKKKHNKKLLLLLFISHINSL